MAGMPRRKEQIAVIEAAGGEDYVFAAVADGMTITAIAEELGIYRQWLSWWVNRPERKARYLAARRLGAEAHVEAGLKIVDEATPESAHLAKIRSDYRKWLAAKTDPATWGQQDGGVTINLGDLHLQAVKQLGSVRRVIEHETEADGAEEGEDWLD